MRIVICTVIVTLLSCFCSDFIKKYSSYIYAFCTAIATLAFIHGMFMVNRYSVTYIPVVREFMKSVDSDALGCAIFIVVMYMGVLENRLSITKKLRRNRAELSIIACILTMPHILHFGAEYFKNLGMFGNMTGLTLWVNLMMLAAGVFAAIIMIPLFITSFKFAKKKMKGKKWKELQQFSYFFYGLIFVHVIMVYMAKPPSTSKTLNLVFYSIIFGSYTVLKLRLALEKSLNRRDLAKKKN